MNRADWFVVLLAIALLPMLYVKLWFSEGPGHQAEIRLGKASVQLVLLDHPRQIELQGPLGKSVLEVRDHRIRFLASPCKSKICIHGGWLKEAGEIVACLPNRISVRIPGADPRFDAINF